MNWKKIITYLFYGLSIYFFYKIITNTDFASLSNYNSPQTYILVLLFALIHGALLLIVAYVYGYNLLKFSQKKVNLNNLWVVINKYVLANVGKYIPGNVVHYVGRNAMLYEVGFSHKSVAFTSLVELIMFALTSMILATFTSSTLVYEQLSTYFNMLQLFLIVIISCVVLLLLVLVIYKIFAKKIESTFAKFHSLITKQLGISSLVSFVLYGLYMISVGFVLVLVFKFIFDISFSVPQSVMIIGGFIIAYFVGMVAPGIPGGIGVRELVAMSVLSSLAPSEILLAALIIHRLITVIGDLVSIGYIKCIDGLRTAPNTLD